MSTFQVVPAIRTAYGRLVGAADSMPGANPLTMVWHWIAQGALRVHVEELGVGYAGPTLPALLLGCRAPGQLQVGGRIHDAKTAQVMALYGASAVVLHQSLRDGQVLSAMLDAVPSERIVAAIGLEEMDDQPILKGLKMARQAGVDQVLLSGTFSSPTVFPYQVDAIRTLFDYGFHVWAAGSIQREESVRTLKELGLSGVIIGRALQRGTLTYDRLKSITDSSE